MIDLTGHTALITGSTQGVGAAIALSLCRAGAKVVLHGLREDDYSQSTLAQCQALSDGSELICFDLNQDIEVIRRAFMEPLLSRHPGLDLLVNNAGIFFDQPFLEMDESVFDRTFHLNVKVPYFLSQIFARHCVSRSMKGKIVFTGSINGLLAEPTHTAYDSSKAAVSGMVRSLCVALAPHAIRVNAMAPGLVRTPLTDQILAQDRAALNWMQLHTPNRTVPSADVCGPMVAFLLSDLAEHIHGQTIYVDGGMSVWQQPDLPDSLRQAIHSTA